MRALPVTITLLPFGGSYRHYPSCYAKLHLRSDYYITVSKRCGRAALLKRLSGVASRHWIGMKSRVGKITLNGFKSIEAMEGFGLGPLTVLIGPNGVGKSNFISFFRLISGAFFDPDSFVQYVSEQGGASKLLHYGSKRTSEISAELTFETSLGEDKYTFRLTSSADDRLVFAEEAYSFGFTGFPNYLPWSSVGTGHPVPRLPRTGTLTASAISNFLRSIAVYQFHDTTDRSRIRTRWNVDDDQFLKEDAANLAPVLYRLRESDNVRYRRILNTIRLVLPFISDFYLEPTDTSLLLRWMERGNDEMFTVSQASDGMLRVLGLVTLLLQKEEDLPSLLILDEPELGLHPYAINVIGGLIDAVSTNTQVLLATQSAALVDCFEPENVVVVDRDGSGSTFNRLSSDDLKEWLDHYSLSELWEKNVFGGRP